MRCSGWFSDASTWGLAREPREPVRIGRKQLGQHLDGDVAVQPRVARAVDLAHAARADRRQDLGQDRAACQGGGPWARIVARLADGAYGFSSGRSLGTRERL